MTTIRPHATIATQWAVERIAANMREWDRREIFATRGDDGPDRLAAGVLGTVGPKWVAWLGDEPVAAIGCAAMWPGLMSPWCFATDKFRQTHLLLTRLAKQVIIPMAREAGTHRLEVKTMEGHTDAQAWLKRAFGAHHEATHPGFGRNRETFFTYVLRL